MMSGQETSILADTNLTVKQYTIFPLIRFAIFSMVITQCYLLQKHDIQLSNAAHKDRSRLHVRGEGERREGGREKEERGALKVTF